MDQTRFRLTDGQNVSTSAAVLATDDHSSSFLHLIPVSVISANDTVYIQKIVVSVTTDGAQTQTFQDTAGTPVPVAAVKVSPGVGPITFDFGPEGFALTKGKGLDYKNGGAAVAAAIVVQAYKYKQGQGIVPNLPGTTGGL